MKPILLLPLLAAHATAPAAVSVRDFGAVGDGITDDTHAIQRALDTANKVLIPEGTFLLTNSLEPREHQEIELNGTLKIADANIQPVTADVPAGQPRVAVKDARGFRVGQWVALGDENLRIQGGGHKVRREGAECARLIAIEGNTLVFERNFKKSYTVAANARVGTMPSAILIQDRSHIRIYGKGTIDGNKAHQFDFAPGMMHRAAEETRAGCGISVHGETVNVSQITIEGITIRDAILHNLSLRRALASAVVGVTCIGAHDKNILLIGCDSCRLQGNTCLDSDFEDGIILYSGNHRCLVQGNLCAGNARLGIGVNAFQSAIALCGNLCVHNGTNITLRGDDCSSTGDVSIGYNHRLSTGGCGVALQGRGNVVTGLIARGNPRVNVLVSATDLLVNGGSIGGEGEEKSELGMGIYRPSEDYRVALVQRVRIRGALFTRCQTAVRVIGVVNDVRLEENWFRENERAVDVAEECRGEVTFRRNEGYATESQGTARIEGGHTSVTVAHGLDVAPRLSDIAVTPANNLGQATKFWIARPTATGFDILVDADPGPEGAEFVWRIEAGRPPEH